MKVYKKSSVQSQELLCAKTEKNERSRLVEKKSLFTLGVSALYFFFLQNLFILNMLSLFDILQMTEQKILRNSLRMTHESSFSLSFSMG